MEQVYLILYDILDICQLGDGVVQGLIQGGYNMAAVLTKT